MVEKIWNKEQNLDDRNKNDFYQTNAMDVIKALTVIDNVENKNKVLDLCAGKTGVWGKIWKTYFKDTSYLVGVELQDFEKPYKDFNLWYNNFDALQYATKQNLGGFDLIVSNPPFRHTKELVEIGYDLLNDNGQMVMLLRLGFLESQKRYDWFKQFYKPHTVFVMSNRPKFVGYNGTYPMAYGIFKWVKNYEGDTKLDWI